jgi:hypothetical protein
MSVGQRIAVDLPGEDDEIRRALRWAERVERLTRGLAADREAPEVDIRPAVASWIDESQRLTRLKAAHLHAQAAANLLSRALVASGTMTDEILF